jgi:tryptophan synthase beta subunit
MHAQKNKNMQGVIGSHKKGKNNVHASYGAQKRKKGRAIGAAAFCMGASMHMGGADLTRRAQDASRTR